MEFIRKPLWALFVLLALGCQQTQTMEKEESDSKQCYHLQILVEIQSRTINEMFFVEKTDKTNFRDIGINLSLVCKYWSAIIKKDAKKWVCEYFNIDEKDKDIFWRLFKGKLIYMPDPNKDKDIFWRLSKRKLIYKPDPNSDNGRVDLFISALPNPLEGAFDLSRCDNAGEILSINMGYRKEMKAENINKVEIWFPLRFLVEKELGTTAGHLKVIFPSEWPESAEVGMLCTWGGDDNINWYAYLTTHIPVDLSKRNLYENWMASGGWDDCMVPGDSDSVGMISSFVCELK